MATATLGSKAVGTTVKLKVNSTLRDFIIVHQGQPSALYDTSCNGTWLLMKDCYSQDKWHSSDVNDYEKSTIHTWLNGAFLNLFEENIRNAIKQVKIPYRSGSGASTTPIKSGANGLSCKIFLLSGYEVGWTTSTSSYFPVDGACLKYFEGTQATDSKRIANFNGSPVCWWLRSPYCRSNFGATCAFYVYSDGDWVSYSCSYSFGIRPALILDSSLLVSDDGSVSTNTAPGMPGSISVPSSISGGTTITVSWTAATDKEGNLSGYKVEKCINGSNTWNQIYMANGLSTQDLVVFGTQTVQYRVKAYDAEGLESGWKTSNQVTVVNNVAPGAPPTITVPNDVKGGGQLTIAWGAASDSDGNLSGYELQRNINGAGEWTQIFKDNATSYTDTITKGWTKVQYRVRAYDKLDATSTWTTSQERTVDNNTAPVITCADHPNNTDLGEKSTGFTISYSVDDVDAADTLAVTEKLDGVQNRQYQATRKQNYEFQLTGEYFQKILNGKHTITITASDGKVTATHTLTFTKKVTEASITLETPMDADEQITICAITVVGSIPADADYKVEVCNNAKDDAPAWEDCTVEAKTGRNYLFKNSTQTKGWAFNFKVTAKRGESGIGGYITSVQGGFQ